MKSLELLEKAYYATGGFVFIYRGIGDYGQHRVECVSLAESTHKYMIEFSLEYNVFNVTSNSIDDVGIQLYLNDILQRNKEIIMDKSVADNVKYRLKFDENGNDPYSDVFKDIEEQMEKTYTHTYSYALSNMTGGAHNDFVAFSSGYGDGGYQSYFGFDETDKPCILVTDFCVL